MRFDTLAGEDRPGGFTLRRSDTPSEMIPPLSGVLGAPISVTGWDLGLAELAFWSLGETFPEENRSLVTGAAVAVKASRL